MPTAVAADVVVVVVVVPATFTSRWWLCRDRTERLDVTATRIIDEMGTVLAMAIEYHFVQGRDEKKDTSC